MYYTRDNSNILIAISELFITLRPEQNGKYFQMQFHEGYICISLQLSVQFDLKDSAENKSFE